MGTLVNGLLYKQDIDYGGGQDVDDDLAGGLAGEGLNTVLKFGARLYICGVRIQHCGSPFNRSIGETRI